MRLSISNIAWDRPEDENVSRLLQQHNIDAIDIAPGKYFPEPVNASKNDIRAVKKWWADRGIAIIGMQSLLFGTMGLNVFGPASSQEAMLSHLQAVCRIAAEIGATRLVFGSPKNRDRTGLNDNETMRVAIDFFRRLGAIAQIQGVIICLEPNPSRYGANFMVTSLETAAIVTQTDHPAIRMQLDTGAMTINSENPVDILHQYAGIIGHIHASEPDLLPLGEGATDHHSIGKYLAGALPAHPVTIEMLVSKEKPLLKTIENALTLASQCYRDVRN